MYACGAVDNVDMVRSKTTGEYLEDNSNNSNNFTSPPPSESSSGRGRRGASRRTNNRGRGRGSSLPNSPNIASNIAAEEEIRLSDIPSVGAAASLSQHTTPVLQEALGATGTAVSKFAVNIGPDSEFEEEVLGATGGGSGGPGRLPRGQERPGRPQADALEVEIAREEEARRRLLREQRLADLRRSNTELKLSIENTVNAIPPEPSTTRFSHARQVVGTGTEPRTRLPLLSQATEGLESLPTLHQAASASVESIPTLEQLRRRPDLQQLVEQQVQADNIWERQQPNCEGNNIGFANICSGRTAKSESGVQRSIVWPHTRLDGRVSNPVFDKLDFVNLFIGELNVVEENLVSEEKRARIKQLKRLLIFSKSFAWEKLRDFHGSFLGSVEKSGCWNTDMNELVSELLFSSPRIPQVQAPQFQYPQQQIVQPVFQHWQQIPPGVQLNPNPQPQGNQAQLLAQLQRNQNRSVRYYCHQFNRGSCPHTGAHSARLNGRFRTVEHFCAHCYLHHKEIANHSEKDCPRPGARREKDGQA